MPGIPALARLRQEDHGGAQADPIPKTKEKRKEAKRKERKES